jgi:hypothetical protein
MAMPGVSLRLEEICRGWVGWMDAYPGAYSQGTTALAATQNAPAALMDYLRWLRTHGETLPAALLHLSASAVHVEVAETVPVRLTPDGQLLPASFASDTLPLGDVELARCFQLLDYAHADLRQAANALPLDLNREPWTLRKIWRRALWHDRYQAAQIALLPQQDLSQYNLSVGDYIDSLDYSLFEGDYYFFWVKTLIDLMDTIGPDRDQNLDRLVSVLLEYYRTGAVSEENVKDIRHAIVRLRGPGFWSDNSVSGRKYRVLDAIGSTVEANDRDVDNWMYGIVTALDLINLEGDKDAVIVRRIKDGLSRFTKAEGP